MSRIDYEEEQRRAAERHDASIIACAEFAVGAESGLGHTMRRALGQQTFIPIGDADLSRLCVLARRGLARPHLWNPARDWTEDAVHENGSYFCLCSLCGGEFIGYKRRVVCKVCDRALMELL